MFPALTFPLSISFGSRKSEKSPADCDVCLGVNEAFLFGILAAILILSMAALVYAARH